MSGEAARPEVAVVREWLLAHRQFGPAIRDWATRATTDPDRIHRGLQNAAFSAAELSAIRRRGWAQSVGEREQGVASVSAPVRSPGGKVIAAVSVSGPLERLSRQPGRMHAPAVLAAAERLSESLRRAAE